MMLPLFSLRWQQNKQIKTQQHASIHPSIHQVDSFSTNHLLLLHHNNTRATSAPCVSLSTNSAFDTPFRIIFKWLNDLLCDDLIESRLRKWATRIRGIKNSHFSLCRVRSHWPLCRFLHHWMQILLIDGQVLFFLFFFFYIILVEQHPRLQMLQRSIISNIRFVGPTFAFSKERKKKEK